ncbi:MAG: DUF1801 domain-containing protein [Bacteroidetes bacterium]|nr:DUF1801 domain-containing protein [Bacteroidota bacterium]
MSTIQDYLNQVDPLKKEAFLQLRSTIQKNIPAGFHEELSYGMIGYVVPHAIYPKGYHCSPHLPLPFVSIAAQKNFIALYHMGIYAQPELLNWFVQEYPKHVSAKLDMGKSCIRFKKIDNIPFQLIAELMKKMSVQDWINCYEFNYVKKS